MSEPRSGSFGYYGLGTGALSGSAARFTPSTEALADAPAYFSAAASIEILSAANGAFSITGTIPSTTLYVETSYVETGYVE